MKLKEFKKLIADYHSDYDESEVGYFVGNIWHVLVGTVPIEGMVLGDVAISLVADKAKQDYTKDLNFSSSDLREAIVEDLESFEDRLYELVYHDDADDGFTWKGGNKFIEMLEKYYYKGYNNGFFEPKKGKS